MYISELITNAYNRAGIVSPDAETPTFRQMSDGLILLNECVRKELIDNKTMPFLEFSTFTVLTEAGEKDYIVSGLSYIETITLINDKVRYPLKDATLREYYGTPRSLEVNSLPYEYYLERKDLLTYEIGLYFIPDKVYELEIKGGVGIVQFASLTDEFPEELQFYGDYFTYFLAKKLCMFNKLSVPADVESNYKDLKKVIANMTTPDLIAITSGLLQNNQGIDYWQINFGKAWTPN